MYVVKMKLNGMFVKKTSVQCTEWWVMWFNGSHGSSRDSSHMTR